MSYLDEEWNSEGKGRGKVQAYFLTMIYASAGAWLSNLQLFTTHDMEKFGPPPQSAWDARIFSASVLECVQRLVSEWSGCEDDVDDWLDTQNVLPWPHPSPLHTQQPTHVLVSASQAPANTFPWPGRLENIIFMKEYKNS